MNPASASFLAMLRRTLAAIGLADAPGIPAPAPAVPRTVPAAGATRSLAWCGEIIAANADDVWRMTTEHILAFVRARTTLVIIELSRLRFIDGAGAAVMLRLKKWAQQWRVEIMFTHPQPAVLAVLRLTCVDRLVLEGGQ